MSKIEASVSKPADDAAASAGVTDVIGEFASSAWRAGVARPIYGVAQLAGADATPEPERNLTGAMRAANIAGSAAGTLADLVVLSKGVGKAVGALGEATGMNALTVEGSLAKNLTTSGTTGFVDGFALNPTQPGEGIKNRFYHGIAEGAGFMALDGSGRLLGRLPEGAITNKISKIGDSIGTRFTEVAPTWASDAGRSATDFLGRNGQKVGDLITSRFPNLNAENVTRNAIAGAVGGDIYYGTDKTLNGKQLDTADGSSTILGWAAANALLGGKLGAAARPADGKVETKPEPPKPAEQAVDAPVKPEVPPPPSYKPLYDRLENGDQQWTYKNVPDKGDQTIYTRRDMHTASSGETRFNPELDWQIKTADGKVYDRNTQGPWEIKYPDGASLVKNESNYLSYNKPISVELGGKPLAVTEVTHLHADQKEIAKQWVYDDPAVPGQKVTFNADRTWEAVGADGKSFNYRSEGPWKVTNIDGYAESRAEGSGEIDVQLLNGLSNWRDFAGSPEAAKQADGPRRPQAFTLAVNDTSPMSLSRLPRILDMERTDVTVAKGSRTTFTDVPRTIEENARRQVEGW
ncbi:MAG TPA: hypothetical protein V6C76_13645 [Drouetiella sp.]